MWNVKYGGDISSNGGNWSNLKFMQEIPGRHTGKTQNKGITENSHIGSCTHITLSGNV